MGYRPQRLDILDESLTVVDNVRAAIVVASHDVPFLGSAGSTRWLRLDRDAGLSVIAP